MNSNNTFVHTYEEVLSNLNDYGEKILRLAELKQQGYQIPMFVGLSKKVVEKLLQTKSFEESLYQEIVQEVTEKIGTQHYAIRSSAFGEDDKDHSQAGQFMTKLDVSAGGISQAIYDIIQDAAKKGYTTEEKPFSIIIQEYIAPDYAGVVFTRNPLGEYQTVIEWKEGNGVGVVSGGQATRFVFSCNNLPKKLDHSFFDKLIVISYKIEKEAGFPQDIEWAVSRGQLYILQSRPITSLSQEQYFGFLLLDQVLLPGNYYYDGTTFGESFTHALPLAQEILKYLYSAEGAIAKSYKSLDINYNPTDIFYTLRTSLFVNKEKELRQFFPTHSYFGNKNLVPHFETLKGLWVTLKNMYRFQTLALNNADIFQSIFIKHIEQAHEMFGVKKTFKDWLTMTSDVYKDVFSVNILAEKAYKDLENILKGSSYKALEIINTLENIPHPDETLLLGMEGHLTGNSLNIADESSFIAQRKTKEKLGQNLDIKAWLEKLAPSKRAIILKKAFLAKRYESLREQGRWVTVMCMSGLRQVLWDTANLSDRSLGYFSTISEIENGSFVESELQKRKKIFEEQKQKYSFPSVISSTPILVSETVYGVSPGEATGRLVSPGTGVQKGDILLVDTLDPSLTQYFDRISGIISRQGGILSHLAIVAREYGIPVVVDQSIDRTMALGKIVHIDGGKGTIIFEKS